MITAFLGSITHGRMGHVRYWVGLYRNGKGSLFFHYFLPRTWLFTPIVFHQVNRYFLKAQDQLWRAVLEFLARFEYRVGYFPDTVEIEKFTRDGILLTAVFRITVSVPFDFFVSGPLTHLHGPFTGRGDGRTSSSTDSQAGYSRKREGIRYYMVKVFS